MLDRSGIKLLLFVRAPTEEDLCDHAATEFSYFESPGQYGRNYLLEGVHSQLPPALGIAG